MSRNPWERATAATVSRSRARSERASATVAHTRVPTFDLALQELGGYLPFEQRLALRKHRRRCFVDEVARARIDEQIFLFNPDGEAGLSHGVEGPWKAPGRVRGRSNPWFKGCRG